MAFSTSGGSFTRSGLCPQVRRLDGFSTPWSRNLQSRSMHEDISEANSQSGTGAERDMILDFVLIIGAMKSGTTTLYNYLSHHPQIATGPKEPSFFAFEETWALGFDWYESLFDYDPARHRYALDASTDYTKHPFCKDVVGRLKASASRKFKLIYIMRHPLRRIESHALHAQRAKREVGQCLSPRLSHSLDAGISAVSMAISRYAYQTDIFSEYYDGGELLLLTLEQLERDPDAVLARVCRFLEIDPLPPIKDPLKSNMAAPRRPPVLQTLYPLWQRLKMSPLRGVVKALVPRAVGAHIHQVLEAWAPPEGRFTLTAEEKCAVIATLTPDLIRLRDRYHIDVQK